MILNFTDVNTLPLPLAALWYAQHNIPVFPCRPYDKRPLTVNGFRDATCNLDVVIAWWDLWPEANIGLALNGGINAIDLDQKKGQNGLGSYKQLNGSLSSGHPVQQTPTGGHHVLFWSEQQLKNLRNQGQFGGIDLQASDSGYILGAPSVYNGLEYQWLHNGNWFTPLATRVQDHIERWCSGPGRERSQPFVLPEPSELEPWEVAAMIDDLDRYTVYKVNRNFLLDGECLLGDQSKQAYLTCRRAFQRGWTLADMARIGPETILATFGSEAPHGARDPWQWFVKYTLRAAWEDYDREENQMFHPIDQKRSPAGDTGLENPNKTSEVGDDQVTKLNPIGPQTKDYSSAAPNSTDYDSFVVRAQALDSLDILGARRIIGDALHADLPDSLIETLLQHIKAVSGLALLSLRKAVSEFRTNLQQQRNQSKVAKGSVTEVYVRSQGKLYDTYSGHLITETAFRNTKAKDFNGDPQQAFEHYVTGQARVCPVVEQLTYDPALPPGVCRNEKGVDVYNQYALSEVEPVAGPVDLWLTLLRSLNLEGGEKEEAMLLDRMAFIIQNPGKKFNHGVLLGGAHGIGKDSFLEPFIRSVGKANTKHVHGSEISSDFTSWQNNCKLVVLNELDYDDHKTKRKVSEILKPALAAPPDTLRINEKNQVPYYIPNRLQCIGFTNHRLALHLDQTERRWLALWCMNQIPRDPSHPFRAQWDSFFNAYWSWLNESKGSEAVAAYLMERDISSFQPGAAPPVTRWQDEMTTHSVDAAEAWITEGIRERRGCFALDIADIETIHYEAMQQAMLYFPGKPPSVTWLGRALARLQIRKNRQYGRGGSTYLIRTDRWTPEAYAKLRKYKARHNIGDRASGA